MIEFVLWSIHFKYRHILYQNSPKQSTTLFCIAHVVWQIRSPGSPFSSIRTDIHCRCVRPCWCVNVLVELFSFECLSVPPVGRGDVVGCESSALAVGYFKRQRLASEVGIALPVLAPVSGHGNPACSRPFHLDSRDKPVGARVCDENLVEVGAPCYGESDPALSFADHPASRTQQ